MNIFLLCLAIAFVIGLIVVVVTGGSVLLGLGAFVAVGLFLAWTYDEDELTAEWLYHPESPGMRVLVVRGFWGGIFKPKDFATLAESIYYSKYIEQHNRKERRGG